MSCVSALHLVSKKPVISAMCCYISIVCCHVFDAFWGESIWHLGVGDVTATAVLNHLSGCSEKRLEKRDRCYF